VDRLFFQIKEEHVTSAAEEEEEEFNFDLEFDKCYINRLDIHDFW